ncbi:MAG: arginine repressor [Candidatus Pelethousia sp.]|nr:arginine repressor [Candidatus Pelethousia sp.]
MKSARHAIILDIIERYNVDTQEDLASRLREQGMNVTQATVSRDIKELRLIKVLSEDGSYKYATVDKAEAGLKDRFISIFAHSVISMIATGNLAIIRTISGTANAAAEAIDSLHWEEIAGTIAGDNTIFIAVKEGQDANELIRRFQTILKV